MKSQNTDSKMLKSVYDELRFRIMIDFMSESTKPENSKLFQTIKNDFAKTDSLSKLGHYESQVLALFDSFDDEFQRLINDSMNASFLDDDQTEIDYSQVDEKLSSLSVALQQGLSDALARGKIITALSDPVFQKPNVFNDIMLILKDPNKTFVLNAIKETVALHAKEPVKKNSSISLLFRQRPQDGALHSLYKKIHEANNLTQILDTLDSAKENLQASNWQFKNK